MFNNKNIFMIGIGGISMSGIAEILKSFNCTVNGYDAKESDITNNLINKGINVIYDYNQDLIKDADIVVYTAAIKDDNPLLIYAKNNKETYERSVFFGLMMKDYKNVICISGTHGKSTTTGMISTIFMKANLNPTIQIGAMLPIINGNYHVGSHEYFIAEACEYCDSFLDFFPTSEVILNIDEDHLDYFKNLDNIIHSFNRYTNLLPENGYLVINNDDENTLMAVKDHSKITYGINNTSNYMAKNINYNEYGHGYYDLYIDNEYLCKVELSVSGIHNIYNSLASIAIAMSYNIELSTIVNALKSYTGVGRRFEYLGSYNNAKIYDDYAHHPSEIETTVQSVKGTKHNKSIAIFQSHTYSRTKDHLEEFAKVLSNFDEVIIAPIYAAREINTYNVKEDDLVKLIKENGNQNVIYIDSFDKIITYLKDNIKEDNLVITIGAGPINEVSKTLINEKRD